MEKNLMQNENFLEQIKEQFSLGEQELSAYSPLVLAYLGDCVYELVVRTVLVEKRNCPVQKLHREATWFVKASTQAAMADFLLSKLSEEEEMVFRRGRNAKSHTVPKNAEIGDYHKATGFEALIGYWYLSKQNERMLQMIYDAVSEVDRKEE